MKRWVSQWIEGLTNSSLVPIWVKKKMFNLVSKRACDLIGDAFLKEFSEEKFNQLPPEKKEEVTKMLNDLAQNISKMRGCTK